MNLLALDCSAEVLCAACARGFEAGSASGSPLRPKHPFDAPDGHAISERGSFAAIEIDAGARHAERAMGAIEAVLKEVDLAVADIDLFACASGPGSFTGLRIATATIKGLAAALGKPWIGVPTLDAYAAEWAGAAPVIVPLIDARRGRFYAAVYVSGERCGPYLDADPGTIAAALVAHPEVLFVGPDAEALLDLASERSGFRVASGGRRAPARSLIALAAQGLSTFGPAGPDSGPIYVRKSDAEEQEERSGVSS